MPKPSTIFFDLDETLVENVTPIQELFSSMYFEFQTELGEDQKDNFFAALRPRIGGLWNTMFLSEESPESQLTRAFGESIDALQRHSTKRSSELGREMFDRFCAKSSANVRLHPGATETLANLRELGFTTGIITNGIEQLQLGKIAALDLANQVDHVIVSAQARAHKPAKQVFDYALEKAAVSAELAWQIGDHATNDVAGAIRAGMSGVFFDPSKEQLETAFTELEVDPTYVIHSLPEVLNILA